MNPQYFTVRMKKDGVLMREFVAQAHESITIDNGGYDCELEVVPFNPGGDKEFKVFTVTPHPNEPETIAVWDDGFRLNGQWLSGGPMECGNKSFPFMEYKHNSSEGYMLAQRLILYLLRK